MNKKTLTNTQLTTTQTLYTINSFQKRDMGMEKENDDGVIQYIYVMSNGNVEYFIVEI